MEKDLFLETMSIENNMSNTEDNNENYTPDEEEIVDAISFMLSCSKQDLKDSWVRISSEWDVNSVIRVHKDLCDNNRITELVDSF